MMKIEMPCSSQITDEQLEFIREMGVEYLAVGFTPEDANYENVVRLQERASKFDLAIANGGCAKLFKNKSIHLGLPDRDEAIEAYNAFTRILGKVGIPCGYIAWQPNGIFRTKFGAGKYTRGGVSMIADMDEINARPIANDRVYGEKEIWDNFKYFIDRALPVCEESNVHIALHPNDPPVRSLGGVHSLIYRTEDYKRAFSLANNSPYLGMKMCIGCWLETGEDFGNLMEDIKTFCEEDKILCVHFRNVSSTVPYFEETLAKDGYADMYAIMKQLVRCGYNGMINIDHAFRGQESIGGMLASSAFPTGYMKGLLDAAEKEIKAK